MLKVKTIIESIKMRYFVTGLAIALLLYFAAIPIRLSVARMRSPQPQAMLVLGGGVEREVAAANFAAQHLDLEVWISTGQEPAASAAIFRLAEVDQNRLTLDYRAVDTVTNFTTTVRSFQQRNITHLYIVTSDFHMRRARAIAFFVLGSRGIAYTPMAVSSAHSSEESALRTARDVGRSLLWLATGRTGARIGVFIKSTHQR